MANKNTHKVTLTQGGISATFRLNDREYELLKKSERPHYPHCLFNFAAFAWADYDISRSKRDRFNSIFNYHKGDFYWYDE
jgi:hypothetical protein